nr:hypothetical protein [Neobacillus sp. Marseille-Q6967]
MNNIVLPDQIKHALEGVYPGHIYIASQDGEEPVDASFSQICYVDERHVALSVEFLNKNSTRALKNYNVFAKVRDPDTFRSWEIELRYLRTVNQGPIYNQMASKLETIASLVELHDLFHLRATDIYEVLAVRSLSTTA